eukprot:6461487-Amphidinium_carterae.1
MNILNMAEHVKFIPTLGNDNSGWDARDSSFGNSGWDQLYGMTTLDGTTPQPSEERQLGMGCH